MKIWIDLINTPQVSFFVPFIRDFEAEGHEVLITCRDSANTVDLLIQYQLKFYIIGEKYTNWHKKKYFFFLQRVYNLFSFVKRHKVDVAASQSSFYQPIVARLLGIPCLYTNDNEHAQGNKLAFLFAKKVILPVALTQEKFTTMWPLRRKVSYYPSVKESIYLSQRPGLTNSVNRKNKIYFRPEPATAQYYSGPINFFDDILLKLAKLYEVVVLPRDKNQAGYYQQEKFKLLKVAQKPLPLEDIIADCLLFIGAGGSMSRELSIIGILVISIYQEEKLCVDNYLIDKGVLILNPHITFDEILSLIKGKSQNQSEISELSNGNQSYQLLKNMIIGLKGKSN